ncbi:MAG: replicative DNA helicase [Clostridia bacterium]|nr:replicative DNA helicase [Clostridia bacterium]MBQ9130708.1 replicative DNA helicase [Clostridia bacterium]
MPFSLEAEQSVLGSIMIDPESFTGIAGTINHTDFYLEEHRDIYLAMQKLFLQSRQIDPVTLIDMLVEGGIKDRDRTVAYVKVLAEAVPTAANIADYARIVRNKSLLRQLIDVCGEISDMAFNEQDEAKDVLSAAESKITAISDENISGDFTHIRDALIEAHAEITELSKNKGKTNGCSTGYGKVDQVLIGLGKGDLVLVGARPGMGKTSFALNLGTNIAHSTGKAVCIFSLEMSNVQLVTRMLSSEALVDSSALRSGNLTNEQWNKLAAASSYLSSCDIYIDDTPGINVTTMKAKLRRVKNLGLVVVDYLGLMQSDRRIDNRVNEVAEISRNLKLMAKEMGVPVICCAQLSRGPESRNDKRPILSDLRDSGAIEQDADIVLFLYRDEYYNKQTEGVSKAEVIIAKNRHGSTGSVELGWFGQYTKFTDLEENAEL